MSTKTRNFTRHGALALALIAACGLPAAASGPDGGDVVYGSAEFIFGDDYLRILTGELTIIDWLNFNIDAGYTVEFLMPGLSSRVLNRINSGVPTEIMGNLTANGQVFIINPAGVIFGQGSVVNVGALYAAAGNLSNTDFIAGVNRFTDARGIVENRGHLRGDLIALIGGRVANHGTISAPNGTVVMAAGERVLIGEQLGRVFVQVEIPSGAGADQLGSSGHAGLDLAAGDVFSLAAWNTGTIDAGSATIHGGGGRAVVSGEINARRGDHGGEVLLLGESVELRGATIDASGDLGGGSVVIGGNPHADIHADRSDFVYIDEHSSVHADALVAGDGGSIVVWSDVFTEIDGHLTARGGAVSGDGGFIETSGLLGLRISRVVDATAANGRGGHWLIDPTNIIIAPGSLGSLGGWGPVNTAVIGVNLINAALNSGMDVTLTTFNPLSNASGEIIQMESAQFVMLSGGEATLTLNAAGSILLHGGAYAADGQSLNLVLNAADPGQPASPDPFSNGRIEINETLRLGGGSLLATGNSILVRTNNISNTGQVSVHAGDIQLVARDNGSIRLGADMTATAGGILLDGTTTLINDVTLSLLGGTSIEATGQVLSQTGAFHDLTLLASDGVITLAGGVGDTGDQRLGNLYAEADLVRVGADVRVLGDMTFEAPVSVFGDAVVFHTGLGTALFGGNIYSEIFGASDIAFQYDGDAWAGVGEGRTPFKFRGSIGVAPEGGFAGGAFRNIRFGNDLAGSPSVSTFLFANAAMAGLDLTQLSLTDLSTLFQVVATDSIRAGRGQKILSFGSLSMTAQGGDSTLIEVGDMTVLGDLALRSLGANGQIRLLGRVAGTIDGPDNEGDRDQPGTADEGASLIAAGSILLEGDIVADPGSIAIGAGPVVLANQTGTGDAGGLTIEVIEGGVGIERFLGTLADTKGLLYAYDLAAFASSVPPTDSRANLAEAFSAEIGVPLRDDERLLADARVLAELGFEPRGSTQAAPGAGPAEVVIDGGVRVAGDTDAWVATIERFSRRSLGRLTTAYTELLGERVVGAVPVRGETARVHREISGLWNNWSRAGRPDDPIAYAARTDAERAETLARLVRVIAAIDLLELTEAENRIARAAMLAKVLPEGIGLEEFESAWFPRPSNAARPPAMAAAER
ncbi:MAG: filamentous hemagglutinin N-terminal domain-containing protein [Phycisphaerales bacterium]|nr:filamentous hemagglutinin N-terminal domain-containing protein [Planctomycetota bacterium]MCH8507712.1 filamentous hemagglutinin N-terminal domain-containing protein [Phycisphaerales bacterium]